MSEGSLLDPHLQGLPSRGSDLELNWSLGFVLKDDRTRCHLIAMAYIPHPKGNQVAASQLAVYAQIEKGKFSYPALHLKSHAQRPDIL